MARVKFIKAEEPNIKALVSSGTVTEGAIYVSTDTGQMYLGTSTTNLLPIKDTSKISTDTNTTYKLSKSGSTITLTGSDGSTTTVSDSNTTYSVATTAANGLMSATDKTKLNGISSGAEVNQNAFSNVVVGETTVAADAKTDTLTLAGSNVTLTPDATNDKITVGITKDNVTSALGYTPPTTNTTYSTATTSANGLMSSSDKTKLDGIDSGANKTTVDSSLSSTSTNPVQNKVINTALSGKAATSHTHTKSQITDFPSSMPASDVYSWAKASTKPTYTASEVGAAASSHKHSASDITSVNASAITGTISSANLPSYVDDIVEGYLSDGKFYTTNSSGTYSGEITGETGKIYTDLSTNKIYRWSGSAYIVISDTLALGETSSTAYRGDRGATAYNHAAAKGSAFSNGLYKITTNAQGHVTAATAVAKSDITGLGIPAQDTVYTHPITSGNKHIPSGGSSGQILRWSADGTAAWGADNNTTYSAGTGISLSGTTFSNSGVRSISSGSANGTISVNTNGTSANVTVKGLGSAAYTDSTDYAAASHTHSYLPLSGGTVTGVISRESGGSWITGRSHATIQNTASTSGSFNVVASQKTASGSWNIGNLGGNESLVFSYDTDTNYKAGTNSSTVTYLPTTGGTIALTSQIPTSLKNPNSLTISLNGTSQGAYDGSAAKTLNITASSIGAASSSHTHSYAGASTAGGAATSANKLNTDAGSLTQPVYFENGVPTATTYSLNADVPSDAVFTDTDTHYTCGLVLGTSYSATTNSAVTSKSVSRYINIIENGTVSSSLQLSLYNLYTSVTSYSNYRYLSISNYIIKSGSSTPTLSTYNTYGTMLYIKTGTYPQIYLYI